MTAVPRVSVVIPCYERPAELARALRSVLAQTVHDFEVVVGDDGSSADLGAVVASFNDDRLRIVRREENGGIGAARNIAIGVARAPWISFLDSDDMWMPRHLEAQLEAATALPERVAAVTT